MTCDQKMQAVYAFLQAMLIILVTGMLLNFVFWGDGDEE
jgi:hypothetical protein